MKNTPAPFEFWKASYLIEVTPLRASSLAQLLTGVTLASEWCLFFHLHDTFFRNRSTLPEYTNDFATWAHSLGEHRVAERLANLNLVRSIDLGVVRREISVILAEHISDDSFSRTVHPGNEFVFCRPRLIAFPKGIYAKNPEEFAGVLQLVDCDSVGYHLFFAPRIKQGPVINDFSIWFREWGYESLALQIDAFDPYLNSLEDSRDYLVGVIESAVKERLGVHS